MNIKDFKVGQTAYLMNFHDRQLNENTTTIDEVSVVSVGKKYVKAKYQNNCEKSFYQRDENDDYLVEKVMCGNENYLFLSLTAADEYKERKELSRWISNKTQYMRGTQYSIEQLREIKRILENPKT